MTYTDDDHTPIRTLVDQLTAQNVESRRAAISELEELLGERPGHVAWGGKAILTRLEDPDPTVRATACRIVAALGIKEARSQLDDLRLDPDATVSNVASESLPRLREADRVEPVDPPAEGGGPDTGTESSEQRGEGDQAVTTGSAGTHNAQTPQQSSAQTTGEGSRQESRRERESRQRQRPPQPQTQSQKSQQQTQSQPRQNAQSQPRQHAQSQTPHQQTSHQQTPHQSTRQQQPAGTPTGQVDTHQGRQQQPQPTQTAESHNETASGQADGMDGKALAVTVGYGLLGLFFAILPVFLIGTFPPDASMGVGSMMAGYMALAGGIVVFVAAALKGSGKPAETTRGVAIFGSLLAIVGIVLIFIL